MTKYTLVLQHNEKLTLHELPEDSVKIQLARWDGTIKNPPKYAYIDFSHKIEDINKLEDLLCYNTLKAIEAENETKTIIPIPLPRIDLFRDERGNIVVAYGDILYSDEVYE